MGLEIRLQYGGWTGLGPTLTREASSHRLRGRGRRRVPEADEEAPEEEDKEPAPQPLQSDDTRVENMDISDEGEEPVQPGGRVGVARAGLRGPGQGGYLSRASLCFFQKRLEDHSQGPQRCWRRMKRSWSCRSSWRRGAACGSFSNSSSCETAVRR